MATNEAPVSPAVAAALIGVRVGRALVLRFPLARADRTATAAIKYTRDAATSAWYAELRAKQAVR